MDEKVDEKKKKKRESIHGKKQVKRWSDGFVNIQYPVEKSRPNTHNIWKKKKRRRRKRHAYIPGMTSPRLGKLISVFAR